MIELLGQVIGAKLHIAALRVTLWMCRRHADFLRWRNAWLARRRP